MTESNAEPKLTASQREAIDQLFKEMPGDYFDFLSMLKAVNGAFRTKIAQVLEQRLNAHYQATQKSSWDYRYNIALTIDELTADLGLCMTHNNEPALLAAERSNQKDSGRYVMLQPEHSYVGFRKVGTFEKIPELKLAAAPEAVHETLQAARAHAQKISHPRQR